MRHVAMQFLTWGTIAGAIGSALLLAQLHSPATQYPIELQLALPFTNITNAPSQATSVKPQAPATESPGAASAARLAGR